MKTLQLYSGKEKNMKNKPKEFVLLQDVVIPRGTVLDYACDQRGGKLNVECVVEMGKDSTAIFNMSLMAIEDAPKDLITEVK